MKTLSPSYHRQRGSAIIYVFAGIILFGALAFSFSRGFKGNITDTDEKTARIGASEVIDYVRSIDRAVNKMLLNSVSENDLGFTNDITTLAASGATIYSGNANCSVTSCEVFSPEGGKVKARLPSSTYLIDNGTLASGSPMAGAIYPNVVEIQDLGTAAGDLVISVYGLKKNVCKIINESFGITNPNDAPPSEDATAAGDQYKGSFTTSTTIGDGVADLAERTDFCYKQSGSSPEMFVYQHVLIIR